MRLGAEAKEDLANVISAAEVNRPKQLSGERKQTFLQDILRVIGRIQ